MGAACSNMEVEKEEEEEEEAVVEEEEEEEDPEEVARPLSRVQSLRFSLVLCLAQKPADEGCRVRSSGRRIVIFCWRRVVQA